MKLISKSEKHTVYENGNVPESQDKNTTQSAMDDKAADIDDSEEVSLDVNDSDE